MFVVTKDQTVENKTDKKQMVQPTVNTNTVSKQHFLGDDFFLSSVRLVNLVLVRDSMQFKAFNGKDNSIFLPTKGKCV